MAAAQQVDRAEAARLLVDDGVDRQPPVELDAGLPNGARGADAGGESALHVDRAAAPDISVIDVAAERVAAPGRDVPHRHHVDVTTDDQALVLVAVPVADHVRSVRERLPLAGLETDLAQAARDDVLGIGLPVEIRIHLELGIDGRDSDQLPGELDDIVPLTLHRLPDGLHLLRHRCISDSSASSASVETWRQ